MLSFLRIVVATMVMTSSPLSLSSVSLPIVNNTAVFSSVCFNAGLVDIVVAPVPYVVVDVVAPVPFTDGITKAVVVVEDEDAEFDIVVVEMDAPVDVAANPLLRCYSVAQCSQIAQAAAAATASSSSVPFKEEQQSVDNVMDWFLKLMFDFVGRCLWWSLIQFVRSVRMMLQFGTRICYSASKFGLRSLWTHKESLLSAVCRFVRFHAKLLWHNKGFVGSALVRSTVFLAKLFWHNVGFLRRGMYYSGKFMVQLAWHNRELIATWITPCSLLFVGMYVMVPWSIRTMQTIRCSIVRMFYRFLRFVVRSVVCCCVVVLFLLIVCL